MSKLFFTFFFAFIFLASQAKAVDYGSFTDPRDGAVYKTTQINGKTWLAENMRYAGPEVTCHANTARDPDFIKNYGCLYTWADAQKACPSGWNLPSKEDFSAIMDLVGGENLNLKGISTLTDLRSEKWLNGKNTSGFGMLPAGEFFSDAFGSFTSYAHFWSHDSAGAANAYYLFMSAETITIRSILKSYGYSVRCIMESKAAAASAPQAEPEPESRQEPKSRPTPHKKAPRHKKHKSGRGK